METDIITALREQLFNIVDSDEENVKFFTPGEGCNMKLSFNGQTWELGEIEPNIDGDLPIHAKSEADKFTKAFNLAKLEFLDDAGFKDGGYQKLKEPDQKWTKPAATKQLVKTKSIPVTNYKYSSSQVQAIKETVAKGATDAEFEMLMYLADRYQLDPILKEIFYSPQMKTIMTSRDGYLKIAQRDSTFEGIQSMAVCENDEFELDVPNHTVIHKFGKGDRGNVIGAWAIVYRKGRHPVIAYAPLKEHVSNNPAWKYKSAMSCKCAESFALKRQFSISGLVTQEEIGFENVIEAEYEIGGEVEASF